MKTAESPERAESASGQETAPFEAGRTLGTEEPQRSNPNVSKNLIVAYVLWTLLFPLGAHRFYLGRWKSAVAILLLSLCFCSIRLFLTTYHVLLDPDTLVRNFFYLALELSPRLDAISKALLVLIISWWLIDALRTRILVRRHVSRDLEVGKRLLAPYALWLPPLGLFGAHRFYLLGRSRAMPLLLLGLFNFAFGLFLLPPGSIFEALSQMTAIVHVVWWIVDAFLMPKWAQSPARDNT